jgi:WD40 repeat protein
MSKIIELHSGGITKMQWSPDGRLLAVPTESGSIIIFDLETQEVRKIGPHLGCVTAVAWDLKAECILTGSLDRSIGLWNVKSGERAPFTIDGHQTPVHSIEWTDEEAYAITCSPDRLRVLDGACLLPGWEKETEDSINEPSAFTAASCSHRTTFLLAIAAEEGKLLRLVSLLSGTALSSVRLESAVRALAWSPVEDLLAVGSDPGNSLFRCTQDGFEGVPVQLSATSARVRALAFSGKGSILASADDEAINIWDVHQTKLTASFENAQGSGIAFHPTQPLIAATDSGNTALRFLDVSAL